MSLLQIESNVVNMFSLAHTPQNQWRCVIDRHCTIGKNGDDRVRSMRFRISVGPRAHTIASCRNLGACRRATLCANLSGF